MPAVQATVTYKKEENLPMGTPVPVSYNLELRNQAGAVVGTAQTANAPFAAAVVFPLPPVGTYTVRSYEKAADGSVIVEKVSAPFEVSAVTRVVSQGVTVLIG